MKKTNKPITKEEAVSILSSALAYCQMAGLTITAGSDDAGGLLLTLPGIALDVTDTPQGARAAFRVLAHDAGSDGTSPQEGAPVMAQAPGSDGTSPDSGRGAGDNRLDGEKTAG